MINFAQTGVDLVEIDRASALFDSLPKKTSLFALGLPARPHDAGFMMTIVTVLVTILFGYSSFDVL